MLARFAQMFTANRAETDPASRDPGLRGRSYAIPFDRVWQAATLLADQELAGWTVVSWNDRDGVIKAEARTRLFRLTDDVTIRICLDENAQTRVDMVSESRKGKADLGTNARRIRRFFSHLDRKLAASEREILGPEYHPPTRGANADGGGRA
jgi:hypothetical protein